MERVHESASVSVLDGADVVYVARVPTSRILTVAITIGTRFAAHATSMGRVLLAAQDPRPTIVLSPLTDRTITDPDALDRELDAVVRNGFCVVDEELELGLASIAVPLHDTAGTVVAAANVSTGRRDADLVRDVLPELRTCAAAIEADMRRTLLS